MTDQTTRWLLGGLASAIVVASTLLLGAQAQVDAQQDSNSARQEKVLQSIVEQQAETAAALREVTTTLKMIDDRGTRALGDAIDKHEIQEHSR